MDSLWYMFMALVPLQTAPHLTSGLTAGWFLRLESHRCFFLSILVAISRTYGIDRNLSMPLQFERYLKWSSPRTKLANWSSFITRSMGKIMFPSFLSQFKASQCPIHHPHLASHNFACRPSKLHKRGSAHGAQHSPCSLESNATVQSTWEVDGGWDWQTFRERFFSRNSSKGKTISHCCTCVNYLVSVV